MGTQSYNTELAKENTELAQRLKAREATIRDLKETLRQKEQELTRERQESEFRLLMALEAGKGGIWVEDLVADKMTISPQLANMLGYSIDELAGSMADWDRIVHPNDWPTMLQRLQDHVAGKTSFYEVEYRVRTKQGDWVWLFSHGRINKWDINGKPLQMLGTHMDITRLKQTEFELRESEDQFRTLVENAPFGLIILDMSKKIEYVNPKFMEIFGVMEPVGDELVSTGHKPDPDKTYKTEIQQVWQNILTDSRRTRRPQLSKMQIRSKNGEEKIVQYSHVYLKNGEHLIAFADITARAQAESALKLREEELEMKTRNLSEMNTALRVLLEKRERDKDEMAKTVLQNIKELVFPYLNKLETTRLAESQKTYLEIVKSNLNDIISPFYRRLAAIHLHLTPKEIQVANLIKEGLQSKEIADLLYVSESSVGFHRYNIRKKLGLLKKRTNLKSYLQSVE